MDETTFVHRIFGGYFRSQLHCSKCGYKSNTYDPFLDLALEVSKSHLDSLAAAFKEFTRKEILDSNNRWKCSNCKKLVCPTKHLSVFRPPLSLCIHLKRFCFGDSGFHRGGWGYGHRHGKGLSMMGNGGSKITKKIDFPAHLSLPLSDGRVCEYLLTGIIVHIGNSATTGHYTAFVKQPGESNRWYHMDDSYVETVSEKTVLKQRDAYVLFYSRKEVKLEFPQPPPRQPALKNGMKLVPSSRQAHDVAHDSSTKNSKTKDDESFIPKSSESQNTETPGIYNEIKDSSLKKQKLFSSEPSESNPREVVGKFNRNSESNAKLQGMISSISNSSSVNILTKEASPINDSSTIKHAIETNSSSQSESTSSDSESSSSRRSNLVDIKRSLSYATKESPTRLPGKNKVTKNEPGKKMHGNNVEVVLSRIQKRKSWTPPEAAKTNNGNGNVLLGNISVGNWNDNEDKSASNNGPTLGSSIEQQSSLRAVATKAMESEVRSRKRKMHLDNWDAMIDEGKVSHSLFSFSRTIIFDHT